MRLLDIQLLDTRLTAAADLRHAERGALARELAALKSEGVAPHTIAAALVRLGLCAPKATPQHTRRACLTRVRVQLHRYRYAGGL